LCKREGGCLKISLRYFQIGEFSNQDKTFITYSSIAAEAKKHSVVLLHHFSLGLIFRFSDLGISGLNKFIDILEETEF